MKTGVLIVNLGTPDSPETKDVRIYLTEFLNDPRVIDIPWLARKLLVNLIIVPFRSSSSSKLYKEIWTEKGSPLLVHSLAVREKLQEALGDQYVVELGMRYRKPSLLKAMENLKRSNVDKIIVFPLFPQYASSSTGSVHQRVMEIVCKWEVIPEIKFVNSYSGENSFIHAWAERAKEYMNVPYDHYLFSFHGLPERQIKKADDSKHCLENDSCCSVFSEKNYFCYRAQCFNTARKIAERIGISNYTVCFQSRLGKDPWVKPYTEDTLKKLAEKNVKKILVFAPAFVSDCLETIYEISIEYGHKFKEFGGNEVKLVESLNTHPAWIDSLKQMILSNE